MSDLLSSFDGMDKARTGIAHLQYPPGQVGSQLLYKLYRPSMQLLGHLPLVHGGASAYLRTIAADRAQQLRRKETDGERSGSRPELNRRRLRSRPQRRGQGAEEERDRVRLQRRDRGRLDRPRLQPRRDTRLRRRRGRAAVAGDPADQLRADVPGRRRLLLHEQGRPGLRHQLLLGDEGDGPAARLDRRLDDRRRRRDRDGQPGPDRRPLHLPAGRLGLGGRLDGGGHRGRRRSGSC